MDADSGAVARIAITGGVLLVDKEDEERVRQVKWSLTRGSGGGWYARNPSPEYGYLARWLLGCPKGFVVDHKNGNPLDNRRENLRVATFQQNLWNRRTGKTFRRAAKYKGVYPDHGRWRARITCNGKHYGLGQYGTQLEAAFAYDAAAVRLFGEFAAPNFPERFRRSA